MEGFASARTDSLGTDKTGARRDDTAESPGYARSNHGPKDILNPWDHAVLEYGLRNVCNDLTHDFGGQLPQVILLPDTGARPLMYALRPVFKEIIKKKGGTMPRFYFFKTDKPTHEISSYESIPGKRARTESELIQEEIRDQRRREDKGFSKELSPAELAAKIDDFRSNARFDDVMRARKTMQDRACEIREAERKRGFEIPSIAIIDEYATEDATTIKEIRQAFDFHVPAYTVFSQNNNHHMTGLGLDVFEEIDAKHLNFDGMTASFTYAKTDSIGVKKGKLDGKKYTEANQPRDAASVQRIAELKQKLRSEMGIIGQEVANSLSEDGYEKLRTKTGLTDMNRNPPRSARGPELTTKSPRSVKESGYRSSPRPFARIGQWIWRKISALRAFFQGR